MKKFLAILLILCLSLPLVTSCSLLNQQTVNSLYPNSNEVPTSTEPIEQIQEYYDLVLATQDLLDTVADDIYSYWYDAIYNDKYYGSIDWAIMMANADNSENLDVIETNTETIKALYSQIKESKLNAEIKAVMQAYNAYYSFVVEVSGSFKSYSADKETLKKELSNALKNLSFELL